MWCARAVERDKCGVSGRALEFLQNDGEDVAGGVFADERVEMAVVGNHVQRVVVFAPAVEKVEGALLAFGEKAVVVEAGHESEASGGGGLLRDEVGGQLAEAFNGDEVARVD